MTCGYCDLPQAPTMSVLGNGWLGTLPPSGLGQGAGLVSDPLSLLCAHHIIVMETSSPVPAGPDNPVAPGRPERTPLPPDLHWEHSFRPAGHQGRRQRQRRRILLGGLAAYRNGKYIQSGDGVGAVPSSDRSSVKQSMTLDTGAACASQLETLRSMATTLGRGARGRRFTWQK